MKRRDLFYIVIFGVLALLVSSSVEFRNLEQKRAEDRADQFNAAQYARDFWENRLPDVLETAQDAEELIRLFNGDMDAAIRRGRTLGHSRIHAYLLNGRGTVVSMDKDGLHVSVMAPEDRPEILLCAGAYVSGKAVRDASGLVDVSAFSDTMKFNRISFEINKIVVQEVIAPFLEKGPRPGITIRFVGAAEVAEEATQEVPFGVRKGQGESNGAYHLLKVVPIQLDLE